MGRGLGSLRGVPSPREQVSIFLGISERRACIPTVICTAHIFNSTPFGPVMRVYVATVTFVSNRAQSPTYLQISFMAYAKGLVAQEKTRIEDFNRLLEESRQTVPPTELVSEELGGGPGVGVPDSGVGEAGGDSGRGTGFGVALSEISAQKEGIEGVEVSENEVGGGAGSGGEAQVVGGGRAPLAVEEEVEVINDDVVSGEEALTQRSTKKRGRPQKRVKIAKHLFVQPLTDEQEVDL